MFFGEKQFPWIEIATFNTSNTILWEEKWIKFLNQICKNKFRRILLQKNTITIKAVKYLKLINRNRIWIILNTASKMCKFTGRASTHSIFNLFNKFQISKVQALNFRNMEYENHWSYIGGGDTYPLQIVALLFNLIVQYKRTLRG